MKTRILFALSLGLATASQVWAGGPGPVKLGGVDAVLTFCGQVNPGGVAIYSAYRTSLVSQMTADVVTAETGTKAYKKAFAEVGTALSSAPRAWAVRACANALVNLSV